MGLVLVGADEAGHALGTSIPPRKAPAIWGRGHAGSREREGVDPQFSKQTLPIFHSVLYPYAHMGRPGTSIFNGDGRLSLDFGGSQSLGVELLLGKTVPLFSALFSFRASLRITGTCKPELFWGSWIQTGSPSSPAGLDPGFLSRLNPGHLNICSFTSKMLPTRFSVLSSRSYCVFVLLLFLSCYFGGVWGGSRAKYVCSVHHA